MNVQITGEAENFINSKISSGEFSSADELIENAIGLMQQYTKLDPQWLHEQIEIGFASAKNMPLLTEQQARKNLLELKQQFLSPHN